MAKREPKVVKLREPVEFGSEKITAVTIRPIVWGDLLGLPEPKLDMLFKLSCRLTGQFDDVMKKLAYEDAEEVMEIVGVFMEKSPKAGTGDSQP